MRLVPFYVAYAGCAVIDNIFIGLGKTGYNAVNSLLINLGYYGAFYALFRARAITFDMQTIILIFGFGMVCTMSSRSCRKGSSSAAGFEAPHRQTDGRTAQCRAAVSPFYCRFSRFFSERYVTA